jgi:serine phosphatase RsbU (regulator of sigma subunit)
MNASLISIGEMKVSTFDDLRNLIPQFMIQLRSYSGVSAILVSNDRHDTMWVERMNDGRAKVALYEHGPDAQCSEWLLDAKGSIDQEEPLGSYDYTPQDRPWYLAAAESPDGRGWSPLYVWASSEEIPSIGCGRSILVLDDADEITSTIVDVGFTVDALSKQLSEIGISPNGEVFIMDTDGHLVAVGSSSAPAAINGEMVLAAESSDEIIARAAQSLRDSSRGYVDELGFRHVSFESSSGEYYQVDSEEVDVAWGPDWILVTVIPESDLLAGVRVVQDRLVYSGIAVLVIAGIAGFFLARSIVNPIVELRQTAGHIIEGDLDARFVPRGGREFAELSDDLEELTRALRERLEMRTALAVAMEVQQHLLPGAPPTVDLFDVAALSVYSDETGGDYYDFPSEIEQAGEIGAGSTLMAIGDVTGHGIGAALIMATARSALRTRLHRVGDLGAVLTDVNHVLVDDVPSGRFMTLLMLRLDSDGCGYRWGSAGHDPPIQYDPNTGEFTEPSGGGVPLGILQGEQYSEYHQVFGGSGSILVAATDGVWETAAPDKELYGKDRLRDLLKQHADQSAEQIISVIIHALNEFRGSERPLDDVTLIVIKRK